MGKLAVVTDIYDGRLNWWTACRDKGRAHYFPVYFQHAGRPATVHETAGRLLGLPAGYGYKIYHVPKPPADLVKVFSREGVDVFSTRLKL